MRDVRKSLWVEKDGTYTCYHCGATAEATTRCPSCEAEMSGIMNADTFAVRLLPKKTEEEPKTPYVPETKELFEEDFGRFGEKGEVVGSARVGDV